MKVGRTLRALLAPTGAFLGVRLLSIRFLFEFSIGGLGNHLFTGWVCPVRLHLLVRRQIAHGQLLESGLDMLVIHLRDELDASTELRVALMADTPTVLRGKARLLRLLLLQLVH